MPRESESKGQSQDRVRVFNGGIFLVHNRHIQDGKRQAAGCQICGKNMGALFEDVETKASKRRMAESARSDEERAATPAPSDETDWYTGV